MMNSPHDWGMWRSSKEDPCQEEAGWPLGKMIVVVVVAVELKTYQNGLRKAR